MSAIYAKLRKSRKLYQANIFTFTASDYKGLAVLKHKSVHVHSREKMLLLVTMNFEVLEYYKQIHINTTKIDLQEKPDTCKCGSSNFSY